jgi:hypothetical protein
MRKHWSRFGGIVAAAAIVAAFSAASVDAAKPVPYVSGACWDAVDGTLVLSQAWFGYRVDSYDFGFSSSDGGAGVPGEVRVAKHGTVSSTGLTIDDTATGAGGALYYQGTQVATFWMDQPTGGWDGEPGC